jgi:hypothetical protein
MAFTKILLGLLAAVVAVWLRPRYAARAERLFSALSIDSQDPRLSLRGATAKVVLDRVDSHAGSTYSLFRICKNEYGEYFLFMYNGSPYVTHLSRDRARHALLVDRAVYEREFGAADAGCGPSAR